MDFTEIAILILAFVAVMGVIIWFDLREMAQWNAMVRDWQQATGDLVKAMKRTEEAARTATAKD